VSLAVAVGELWLRLILRISAGQGCNESPAKVVHILAGQGCNECPEVGSHWL
jgi:hypothetical protein